MAEITIKEVEHVAELARLRFDEQELEEFTNQLDAILKFVGKLESLDTEGVEPTYRAIEIVNCFREDEVKPSLPVEEVSANAPESDEGAFVVPRII